MKKYLMVVDVGIGSVCVFLFDLKGNQIGCVQKEWIYNEDLRWLGSMDFDWIYNWNLVCSCICGVIDEMEIDLKEIVVVFIICMCEGIVLYDKDGKEIWVCVNVDVCVNDEVEELIKMDLELEKEVYFEFG